MEEKHKKWEKIHYRLKQLEHADQEEEAKLLTDAYDNLIMAYQEARELNAEMEELLKAVLCN